MLKIIIPDNNIPEREYVVRCLFFDFLGLDYHLVLEEKCSTYTVCFEDKQIIFKDAFFANMPVDLSYLNPENVPLNIHYLINEFTVEKDIPVIYGTDEQLVCENIIFCGIDIFASSYFMLTRWEELIHKFRDNHNRFPGIESIAYKYNFLTRPLVNEYVEMLWNMMIKLGFKGERKKRSFEVSLTHDIDGLTYSSARTIMGDFIKRKDFKLGLEHTRFLLAHDPYDTFDFLMTCSEKIGVKSHFYFMASDTKREFDTGYYLNRGFFRTVVRRIKDRGHIIGFHPGYYTYDDAARWVYEKQLLEEAIKQEVKEGRQHFLRLDISKTLSIWDSNNMLIDSTLGYADKEGFRCGTGDDFYVFDIVKRQRLRLRERPLIVMDGTIRQYQNYSLETVSEKIRNYFKIGKKYNMGITLLFHNSSFYGEWEGYKEMYGNLMMNGL